MRTTLLLIIFFFIAQYTTLAQTYKYKNDTVERLGKRKNIIWDRTISPRNLNSLYTFYYPLYFTTQNHTNYQKVGILGAHIHPYLKDNAEADRYFKKYRTAKLISYVAIPAVPVLLGTWVWVAIKNYTVPVSSFQLFFNKNTILPLAGYAAVFAGGIYLNMHADTYLQKSVEIYRGGRSAGKYKRNDTSLKIQFSSVPQQGVKAVFKF
jgi:hypothetical protein